MLESLSGLKTLAGQRDQPHDSIQEVWRQKLPMFHGHLPVRFQDFPLTHAQIKLVRIDQVHLHMGASSLGHNCRRGNQVTKVGRSNIKSDDSAYNVHLIFFILSRR